MAGEKLNNLRSQLAALRRRRRGARWGAAAGALLAFVSFSLLVLFGLDVAWEPPALVRAALLSLLFVGLGWAGWRFARPLLGARESLEQLALDVERQHGIQSDLVAALQFESADAAEWGSPQLEGAVVERVAALGGGLDVFAGFSTALLRRRVAWAMGGVLLFATAAILFPRHMAVFGQRLLLSNRHYPTDTRIDRVTINARPVLVRRNDETAPREARVPQGAELVFRVQCSGELPDRGEARLESVQAGGRRTIPLQKITPAIYEGKLPRFVDPVEYQLTIGDAWTDPARVTMAALPIVEMRLSARPPDYAKLAGREAASPAARHISVLEGSEVDFSLEAANGKQIETAQLAIRSGESTRTFQLQADPRRPKTWRLAHQSKGGGPPFLLEQTRDERRRLRWTARPIRESPLMSVTRELRFEALVVDEDGLSPAAPLTGAVLLRLDRPPHATAAVVHQVVLPTARPVVTYQVSDDFGIRRLALAAKIDRASDDETEAATVEPEQEQRVELLAENKAIPLDQLPLHGQYAFDLSRLSLKKGDRLELVLEAMDDRGTSSGETFRADPIRLEISDESGVLAAISAADERSEERLTELIEQQLGIGGSP